MSIDLDVPHHTTLSRRSKNLGNIKIIEQDSLGKFLDIFIDSTGVSIHNGNKRKPTKNKPWRKFHAAVDGNGNIVASELTCNRAPDSPKVNNLVRKIENPLASVMADSAYDNNGVYDTVSKHLKNKSSKIVIPPKRNAVASDKSHPQRNRNILSRDRYGKRSWIKKSKYNQRNRVENTFFRYKQIISPSLKARTLQGQRAEMQSVEYNDFTWNAAKLSKKLGCRATGNRSFLKIVMLHQRRFSLILNRNKSVPCPDTRYLCNYTAAIRTSVFHPLAIRTFPGPRQRQFPRQR